MARKYFHQLITGLSFGLTSAVITALGVIVGLNSATSSELAVVAGIIVLAVSDGLADAAGMHMAEETEVEKGKDKYTTKEVWLTTVFTFMSVCGFVLTFAVPFPFFSLETSILIGLVWGFSLLIVFNLYLAKLRKKNPITFISGHVLLAVFVVLVSFFIGNLIAAFFAGK